MELFGIKITTDMVVSACMVCCTIIAIVGIVYTFKEIHTLSHNDKEDEDEGHRRK